MMTFAKRFTANDLLQEGIISAALPYDELIEGAKNTVRPWVNKGRKSDVTQFFRWDVGIIPNLFQGSVIIQTYSGKTFICRYFLVPPPPEITMHDFPQKVPFFLDS